MVDPIKLLLKPGINRETTDYGNSGGYYDCNLVRFHNGHPESIGGWQRFTNQQAQGTFRSLFPWSTLNGARFYGAGTNWKYYIINTPGLVDITPIRRTATLGANPFTTSGVGSTTIIVTDASNGAVLNDFVTFSGSAGAISGIPAAEFNAEHQITSILTANTYTIEVTTGAAAGGVSGGGAAVVAAYQINVGLDISVVGNGWGVGPWGSGTWGSASGSSADLIQLRLWTQDNFGEDLLFNVRDGGIYFKDMSGAIGARGVNITTLGTDTAIPVIGRQVLVSDNDRHVIIFGTNGLTDSTQDRLLARWSDSENQTIWTPDTTNTAGSLRFNSGSEFMKAVETQTEMLVFTDVSLHSMRFVGPPYTFGQQQVGSNIKLIGPNAVATTGSETYWMATNKFQMYDGRVQDLYCTVLDYVFDNLTDQQAYKIAAGINREFSEVIWLLPMWGATENNFYVIFNYSDGSWYYGAFGDIGRTTWLDAFFETTPLATAADGYVYSHDDGAVDGTEDPVIALDTWLEASVIEQGNGGDFMYLSRFIPDFDFTGSSISAPELTVTFRSRKFPGSPFGTEVSGDIVKTASVDQYTYKNDFRLRGQSVQYRIGSDVTGTKWKQGIPRLFAAPDGRR